MIVIKKSLPFILLFILVFGCFLAAAETAEELFPTANTNTIDPLWRHAPGGALLGVPTIQAGTVVAVLEGGILKAYTLEGRPLWDYLARTSRLIPYVSRNREVTSYICQTDGTLIAVNRSGRELWRLKPGPITAPVISGWDGRIFVTTEETILCYTASGYLLWSNSLDAQAVAGPFLTDGGGIVAALENGELLELNPFGRVQSRNIGETPAAIIPVKGGTLVLLRNGQLRLFYSDSDTQTRTITTLRGSPLGGVSLENDAVILLSNGSIVRISLSNGRQSWSQTTHIRAGNVTNKDDFSMLWDERGIYIFSRQGATGFSADGRRLWTLNLTGASSIPVLGDNGILFSGGHDWILYAYRVENRSLARPVSLFGPAPEGNYSHIDPPSPSITDDLLRFNVSWMDRELQLMTQMIQEGTIGENEPTYAAYLKEIAGSSIPHNVSRTRPPVHVRHRMEAARLLGFFGSRETIPFLAELYLRDPDSAVKAAAAEAIGRIGTDPDGIALQAFAQTINVVNRDEQTLSAAASAIGSLCRFSGPPLSDSGIRLLNMLEREFMPSRVRSQARQEIASLL